jgi:hypothetical protein
LVHRVRQVSSRCWHASCADNQRPDRFRRCVRSATIVTGVGRKQPSPSQSMQPCRKRTNRCRRKVRSKSQPRAWSLSTCTRVGSRSNQLGPSRENQLARMDLTSNSSLFGNMNKNMDIYNRTCGRYLTDTCQLPVLCGSQQHSSVQVSSLPSGSTIFAQPRNIYSQQDIDRKNKNDHPKLGWFPLSDNPTESTLV